MRSSSRWFAPLALSLLAACDAAVKAGELGEAQPPAAGGSGGGAGTSGMEVPDKATVAIVTPDEQSQVDAQVTITGEARAQSGVASVFVAVGPNVAVAAKSDDGFRTWSLTAPAPLGSFQVTAQAFDSLGVASPLATRSLSRPGGGSDAAAPTVTITAPADGSSPAQPTVLVEGTAADDLGVVAMEVRRNGELLTERAIETETFFATWGRLVTLLPGQKNELVFRAYDASGHQGEARVTLQGPATLDTEAPTVAIKSPAAGSDNKGDTLAVAGAAFDNKGVAQVKVRLGVVSGTQVEWQPYAEATTSDGFATWSTSLAAPPGALRVQARAIDVSGLAQVAEVDLANTYTPIWGDEDYIPLRLRDGEPAAQANLELDRAGVDAIMNEQIQRDTLLLEVDPTALLESALDQIKVACGTDWKKDSADPKHNCALTPLGQSFKGPDGTWRSSAEYSLVRLLTMTPANVVVQGTSIAGLQNIADGAILGIKIGGGFNQVLAETLGIARTREIVTTAAAAQALRTEWMTSHPSLPKGTLPVTLYDAMHDLSTLGDLLGPKGTHPGVVDPSVPPSSQVFGPDFKMILDATSNLRWRDGIDLSKGKDYLAIIDDPTGQNSVLAFDFNDPQKFDVQGLVAAPTVDLRLKILENAAFISSCSDDDACKTNLPGKPLNGASLWAQPGWQLERIVGAAARNDYKSRVYNDCMVKTIGCQAEVNVGQNGDPAGWTNFDIIFNIGNPPKDQYLWELIGEVAQVALHNIGATTVPEGQANVAFTLSDIPVGLTAEQIRQAVRPYLQDQAPELSKSLLGDYAKNNGAVDLFYQRGDDGAPYLFFIAASDPRPVDAYAYTRVGFFDDLALTQKASSTADGGSGDTTHEKLKLTPGDRTVYLADDTGKVHRLRITTPAGSDPEVLVRVSHKL